VLLGYREFWCMTAWPCTRRSAASGPPSSPERRLFREHWGLQQTATARSFTPEDGYSYLAGSEAVFSATGGPSSLACRSLLAVKLTLA
jgi:hypothetical protein